MKFETNMVFGEPNANGRVYNEDMFKKAIADALNGTVLIYPDYNSAGKQDIMKAIGVINRFSVKDKKLTLNGDIIDDDKRKFFKEMFKSGNMLVTTSGVGRVEDGEVKDYKLLSTFIVDKDGNDI